MKQDGLFTLTLDRSTLLNIRSALSRVELEYRKEARNLERTDKIRECAEREADFWATIRKEIARQFVSQVDQEQYQE